MELLANELSIHEQFAKQDISAFRQSMANLLEMRKIARQWGRDIYCTRRMAAAMPMPGVSMPMAAQRLREAQRRAVLQWLNRSGPFWDDKRQHGEDEWLEDESGEVVTDSAIGEAAYRTINGIDASLVSVIPSEWDRCPVWVTWRGKHGEGNGRRVALDNWRNIATLLRALEEAAPAVESWHSAYEMAVQKFDRIVFADRCFEALEGCPFAKKAANHLMELLAILNRLGLCFGRDGAMTQEGYRIREQYFAGGNAKFSDSSATEKREFRRSLSFRHPKTGESTLFGWHGKMARHAIRFHFSWPVKANEPIYVVYVGPKLTKQ